MARGHKHLRAARALLLCGAWPALEQLELRFDYSHATHDAVAPPFQAFVDDLAATLRHGGLPRLRYLWLGSEACTHCFGQRYADGRGTALDDRALLEELKPTAALWWMAERAEQCAPSHPARRRLPRSPAHRPTRPACARVGV